MNGLDFTFRSSFKAQFIESNPKAGLSPGAAVRFHEALPLRDTKCFLGTKPDCLQEIRLYRSGQAYSGRQAKFENDFPPRRETDIT